MKRKLIFAGAFLLIAFTFTSCESLNDCQFCKIVTRDSGGTEIDSTGGADYCGIQLTSFKAANPTITDPVTGNVTKVECN